MTVFPLVAALLLESTAAPALTFYHCVPDTCSNVGWSCSSGNFRMDSARQLVNGAPAKFTDSVIIWQDQANHVTWTLQRKSLNLQRVQGQPENSIATSMHCRAVPNFHNIDGIE